MATATSEQRPLCFLRKNHIEWHHFQYRVECANIQAERRMNEFKMHENEMAMSLVRKAEIFYD